MIGPIVTGATACAFPVNGHIGPVESGAVTDAGAEKGLGSGPLANGGYTLGFRVNDGAGPLSPGPTSQPGAGERGDAGAAMDGGPVVTCALELPTSAANARYADAMSNDAGLMRNSPHSDDQKTAMTRSSLFVSDDIVL